MNKNNSSHMVRGGRAKIAAKPVIRHANADYTTLAYMAMQAKRRHDSMDRSYRLFLASMPTKERVPYKRVDSDALDPDCGLPNGRTEVLVPVRLVLPFLRYLLSKRAISVPVSRRIREDVDQACQRQTLPPNVAEVLERKLDGKSDTDKWPATKSDVPVPVGIRSLSDQKYDDFVRTIGSIGELLHKAEKLAEEALQLRDRSGRHESIDVSRLISENAELMANNLALKEEIRRLTTSKHQLMEAGHVPFEALQLEDGKVWTAAELRRLGTWFTIQDLWRQYLEKHRVANLERQLDIQQFSRFVYWVFCTKLRDAANTPVPRAEALTQSYCSVLRIRIPDANTYAREQHAIMDAVRKKIPVAAVANWVPQLWFSSLGVAHLFGKFDDLFHQWERAGFPQHAANRMTRKTPTEDVQTPT